MSGNIVSAHEFSDQDELEEELSTVIGRIQLFQKGLAERPAKVIGNAMMQMHEGLIFAAALATDHAVCERFRALFHNVALANFRFGAGSEAFDLDLDGHTIHLVPETKTEYMGVDQWKKALDACLLSRDIEGLRFLAGLDESVFINSNQGASAFDLCYFRLWAHFFKDGTDTGTLLVAAAEAATKPQEGDLRTQYVNLIRYPEIRLLQAIVEGNEADFQKALHQALVDHRTYWSHKDRQYSSEGWISLPLAATCVMAVDTKKFKVEVESPYIPSWLYLGK